MLVQAQPQIKASVDAVRIYVGDTFTYKVEVKNAGQTPTIQLPGSRTFSIVSGPMQSTSFTIINGVQSSSRSVTYTLVALDPGKLIIPPSRVILGSKTYETNSVDLEVLNQGKPSQTTTRNRSTPRSRKAPTMHSKVNQPNTKHQNLLVRAIANREAVVIGEPLTVIYKLYTLVRVLNYNIDKLPDAVGFWTEEIPLKGQPQLKAELWNGANYQAAVLKKAVFYPTQTGELTIDPLRVTLEAEVKTQRRNNFFNDPFFNDFFTRPTQKVFFTNALKIKVKDVPRPAPIDYSGAVGRFKLSAHLDTSLVNVNDAVGFSLTLRGTGNFKTLNLPDIQMPDGIDLFKPEKDERINLVKAEYRGYKRMTYLLVPRQAGDIQIPVVTLTYYDPDAKKYVTTKSSPLHLKVNPVSGDQPLITSGYTRKEVALMNQDLRYIKLESDPLRPRNHLFVKTWWFWSIILLGVFIFSGTVLWDRRRRKIGSDVALGRRLRAWNKAQTALKNARKQSNAEARVYQLLNQALVGYIGDRLNLPEKALITENLVIRVSEQPVNPALVKELEAILIRLDMGRFAPGADASSVDDLIKHATTLLNQLSKELK